MKNASFALRVAGILGLMLWTCPPSSAQAAGSLDIRCSFACRISIPGIQPETGSPQERLHLANIPAGTYTATFSGFNKRMTYTFEITEGNVTKFTVNIASGKVSDDATPAAVPTPPVAPAPTITKTAPKSDPAMKAKAAAGAKTPEPFAGPSYVIPEAGITMIAVAPGSFTMGSLTGAKNEKPLTHVAITNRFWLSRTEVTQAQWQSLMEYNNSLARGGDMPVTNVSWDNAMDFCRRLSEREHREGRLPEGFLYVLPSEAQWEYACRAGGTNDGDFVESAWFNLNSGGQCHPVGQKLPNAWGFYDMHGNVEEWCFDWFGDYPGSTTDIPDYFGPAEGTRHSIRGGAFAFPGPSCRSSYRSSEVPGNSHPNVGFRLALVKIR